MAESILDIILRTKKQGTAAKEFQKDLKEIKGGLAGAVENMTGLSMSSLGMGAAIAAAGAFLRSAVVDTAAYAREVANTARTTGTSYEEASKLLQIGDDLKISNETLKQAFKQLNDGGIQPNIDNLKDLATKYQSMKDPVERAQYAMDLFGKKAGPEMQKLLEKTPAAIDEMAESAEKAGLVMGGDAVRNAERYDKAVDNLNDTWEGFKIIAGTAVIPIVTKIVAAMQLLLSPTKDAKNAFEEFWKEISGANDLTQQAIDSADVMANSYQDVAGGAEAAKEKVAEVNRETIKASEYFKKLTVEMLYNKAAAGLDADAALYLARQMGLVNETTYSTYQALDDLKKKYDLNKDGAIDAAEATSGYTQAVLLLKGGIDDLQSKDVDVTVNHYDYYYVNGNPSGGGSSGGGGTGGGTLPTAGGGFRSAGQKVRIAEFGPELGILGQNAYFFGAEKTKEILSGGSSGPMVSIGEVHIHNDMDYEEFKNRLIRDIYRSR